MLFKNGVLSVFAHGVARLGTMRLRQVANHGFADSWPDATGFWKSRLTTWGELYRIDSEATVVR